MLTEPAAVATRAVERALGPGIPHIGEGLGLDKSVLVLGAGPIGQARGGGAEPHRHRLDYRRRPKYGRLELARTMGAHQVLAMGEGSPEQRQLALQDMTAGVGADIVIETAGVPVAFKESLDLVRRGGIVVEVGHFHRPRGRGDSPAHRLF